MMLKETNLERGYVICGYARSGSTLLAEALKATGQLGYPQEYFFPNAIVTGKGDTYPRDRAAQVAEIAKRGTTGNGVYGLKLFCDQFDALCGFDWASQLPNLHFVHLERRDTLGQAISWVRAKQSDQWTSEQPFIGNLEYDEHAIAKAINKFAVDRARWSSFFARNGVSPLHLVYEEMVHNLPQAVRGIGNMLGIDVTPTPSSDFLLRMQRDELTAEWRARFTASRRDLRLLDNPFPKPYDSRLTRMKQFLWSLR
jgi:trehalose 2-sulfotransferase